MKNLRRYVTVLVPMFTFFLLLYLRAMLLSAISIPYDPQLVFGLFKVLILSISFICALNAILGLPLFFFPSIIFFHYSIIFFVNSSLSNKCPNIISLLFSIALKSFSLPEPLIKRSHLLFSQACLFSPFVSSTAFLMPPKEFFHPLQLIDADFL